MCESPNIDLPRLSCTSYRSSVTRRGHMLSPEFLHLLGGFEAGSSTELLGRPVVCRGQEGSCRPCRERGRRTVLEPGSFHLHWRSFPKVFWTSTALTVIKCNFIYFSSTTPFICTHSGNHSPLWIKNTTQQTHDFLLPLRWHSVLESFEDSLHSVTEGTIQNINAKVKVSLASIKIFSPTRPGPL